MRFFLGFVLLGALTVPASAQFGGIVHDPILQAATLQKYITEIQQTINIVTQNAANLKALPSGIGLTNFQQRIAALTGMLQQAKALCQGALDGKNLPSACQVQRDATNAQVTALAQDKSDLDSIAAAIKSASGNLQAQQASALATLAAAQQLLLQRQEKLAEDQAHEIDASRAKAATQPATIDPYAPGGSATPAAASYVPAPPSSTTGDVAVTSGGGGDAVVALYTPPPGWDSVSPGLSNAIAPALGQTSAAVALAPPIPLYTPPPGWDVVPTAPPPPPLAIATNSPPSISIGHGNPSPIAGGGKIVWQTGDGWQNANTGQCGSPVVSGAQVSFVLNRNPGCMRNQLIPANNSLTLGQQYTWTFNTTTGMGVDAATGTQRLIWQIHDLNSPAGDSPVTVLGIEHYPGLPQMWYFQSGGKKVTMPYTEGGTDSWKIVAVPSSGNGSASLYHNGSLVFSSSGPTCGTCSSPWWNFGPYNWDWTNKNAPSSLNSIGIVFSDMIEQGG